MPSAIEAIVFVILSPIPAQSISGIIAVDISYVAHKAVNAATALAAVSAVAVVIAKCPFGSIYFNGLLCVYVYRFCVNGSSISPLTVSSDINL